MTKPDTLFLKPVEGRRVRREDGPLLAQDGEFVSPSAYWDRRLADGDVEAGRAPRAPAATKES